ncbi:MAG: T9SS type A sorting domain-containing protein [Cryomorphaceae bacterium]|nr:T9SS type A sorting domain-containing protein [Cryomorphaceae bacterium]
MHIHSFQNNDILLVGKFNGLYDFDLDSSNQNLQFSPSFNSGQFMARYTQSGELVWVRPIISPSQVIFYGITLDSLDNIFVTGVFVPSVSFTPGNPAHTLQGNNPNNGNGFLAKFNDQGEYLWSNMFSGNGVDAGMDIKINSQGNIIVLGHVSQTVTFESGNPSSVVVSAGSADIFIASYDPSGQFQWVNSIPGVGVDNARSMALDAQDNIYIMGDFTSTITFPTSPPTPTVTTGANDVFFARFTPNGDCLWGKKVGGTSTDLGSHLTLVGDTTIVINGNYRLNIQFDHGGSTPSFTTPNSSADVFMAAYDTSGGYLWNVRFGSSGQDESFQTALDDSNRIWITGQVRQSGNLDPDGATAPIGYNTVGNPYLAAFNVHNGNYEKSFAPESQLLASYHAVHCAPDGSIYGGGRFRSEMDLNPSGSPFLFQTPQTNITGAFWAKYHQDLDTAWMLGIRKGGDEEIRRVEHDAQGNVFIAGIFEGTIDFNPGDTNRVLKSAYDAVDCFVASYTPNGELRWVQTFGGQGDDFLTAFRVDPSGNVFLGGHFWETFLMPNGNGYDTLVPVISGVLLRPDAFFIKLDNNGNFIYGNQIGGANDDFINDFGFFGNGDMVITGDFRGGMDFDPALLGQNTFSGNNSVAYFARYSAQGQFLWAKLINGSSNQFGQSVFVDQQDNILLTGAHRGTTDFDPGSGTFPIVSNGSSDDVFVAKYNSIGDLTWAKGFGSTPFSRGFGISADANENVYLTGNFSNTTDFNPGGTPTLITSNGNTDVFVMKLSAAGNLQWVVPFGGPQEDAPRDLKLFGDKIYTTGFFQGSVDFNHGQDSLILTSNSLRDMYLHVLDTMGNFFNAVALGGNGNDYGLGISHFAGNTYVGGFFANNFDANPGLQSFELNSLGGRDAFLVKLGNAGPCPTVYDTLFVTECDVFFWNNESFTESGRYSRVLTSPLGCDSIVTLELNLGFSFDTASVVTACDAYSWKGQTYEQSGMYYDSLLSQTGCDSVLVLNLTIDHAFSDTLLATSCNEYQWRGQTYTQSGIFVDSLLNSNGCDSVFLLHLTIDSGYVSHQTITACDSFFWRGQTFTQSGVYTDSLFNSNGCDSVFVLDLLIDTGYVMNQSATSCGSYSWRGKVFSQSGVYRDSLLNANGCDSVFQLHLNIDTGYNNLQTISACKFYNLGGQIIIQSGLYIDSLVNSNGCDSIIAWQITIDTVDVRVNQNDQFLEAQAANAQFQWLNCQTGFSPIAGETQSNFTALVNGDYAVEVNDGICTDTSDCFTVNNIGIDGFDQNNIRIFPNPGNGVFFIEIPKISGAVNLNIMDATGSVLYHRVSEAQEMMTFQLDVAAGTYFVRIAHDLFLHTQRIIVIK